MNRSFEIPIRISLFLEVTVEADSLKEAEQKALTFGLSGQHAAVEASTAATDGEDGQWCEFDQTTKLGFGEVSDG